MYWNEKVEIYGSVPVKTDDTGENIEYAKIEFCIKDQIPRLDRLGRKNRQPNFSVQTTRKEYDKYVLQKVPT